MMAAAPPPGPPAAEELARVESAADHSPLFMMGFTANGSKAALAALAKRAKALKIESVEEGQDDETTPAVMIAFPPSASHSAELNLYRQAVSGAFGTLSIRVLVIPAKASGEASLLDDARVEPASAITVPDMGEVK